MRKRTCLDSLDARRTADAARHAASEAGLNVSIAIVDDGSNLLYFERMDGAALITGEAAIEKARSACLTRRDTKAWEERTLSRPIYLRLPILPLQGGVVINVGEECVGAIGVSGGTPDQDGEIAAVGARAASDPST